MFKLLRGIGSTRVVFHRKRNSRFLTREPVLHFLNLKDETLQAGRIRGHQVCSLDGSVEIQLALRNVADRALVVADLRSAGVIGASGEVHVVVAGSARHARRPGEVSGGLRGAGLLLVAHFAAARVGREDDGRPIGHASLKADDLVRLARLNAGQLGTHVDLVSHHGQVDRVAGIGIGCLRCVAQNAHLDAAPRSAMRGELVMAPVAALGSNDVAHDGDGRTVGHEVEGCACVIRAQVKLGQVTRCVDADRVCGRPIEARWRVGRERVAVPSPDLSEDAVGLGGRLSHRAGDRAGRAAGYVVDILLFVPAGSYAAMKLSEIAPGVDTPVRSNGTPLGSVTEKTVLIVPSWAISADVMLDDESRTYKRNHASRRRRRLFGFC